MGVSIILIFFSTIAWRDSVFCYDTNIAHPNIADLAAKTYFAGTGHELTTEQINCLRTGAKDEDMPIRWMNHFYDPIYNTGFKSIYLTAKDWSRASELQRDYAFGDQTWQRAIEEYKDGNEEQAFCTLGHILHLIADMSVPAHTRDDAHPEGDSYEQFVKYNWDVLYNGLENVDMNLIYYSDLDNYFDNLANYSNNNFYSDDTIENNKYFVINIDNYEKKDGYFIAQNKDGYIFIKDDLADWKDSGGILSLKNQFILTDYTKHLLPQAVGYSAGVIKLFFEEVEKNQDFDLNDKKISFLGKMGNMLGWGVNKLADLKQYIGGGKDVVMADENTVLSVMNSTLETASENEIPEVVEIPDIITPELIIVTPPKVVIYEPVEVEEESTAIEENYFPVPPGFPENNTEVIEEIIESNDDEVVEKKKVYYGGGGTQNNADETQNSTDEDDGDTMATSTPVGDGEDDIDDDSESEDEEGDEDGDSGSDSDGSDDGGSGFGDGEEESGEEDEDETVTTILPTIEILSHEDISYTNVSSTVIITTSSDGVAQVFVNNEEAELTPSSTWQIEVDLVEGENNFEIYGENVEGLRGVTSTINIILDTTAPEVLSVETQQIEFTTPTIRITWTAEDAGVGVSDYDLEYSVDGGDWITIVTSTASTTYDFVAENLLEYNFRVKAYDEFGYASDWKESLTTQTDWLKTVVVNEVAWMGTVVNKTEDEWLELYNNTDEAIDLTGWKILVSGDEMGWDNVGHIIPAGGYYLLERTDDNSILEAEANAIFTLSGGFGNSGENIVLQNNVSSTIDQVDCSNGWFAGTAVGSYRTMERLNPNQPGGIASNWQTSESVAPKGRPYGGDAIYGSPGYQNTGYWLLRGNPLVYYPNLIVDNKLTLTKANSPYIIDYSTQIPANLTVEVEPGVVFMGVDRASYINVKGELILSGTVEDPIIFTSALDTNYVESNLTRLEGESPQPGDWSRIEIEENGVFQAVHTKFLYGGQTFTKGNDWVYGTKWISQVLRNTGGTANLDNVEFNYNYIDSENPNYNAVVWTEAPLGYNASTIIENSILDSGYTSTNFYGQTNGQVVSGAIKNSQIKNFINPESIINIRYSEPELANNTLENNSSDYIDMGGWTLSNNSTLAQGEKYLFSNIIIPTDKTLTIEPGVDIKISGYIKVDGSLHANGEVGDPINFIPKSNYWNIMLFNNSNSSLSNINLTHGNGGGGLRAPNQRGMVTADNSTILFDNVNFMDAERPYHMLYLENSQVNIKDSTISWTDGYTGSKTVDGIYLKGGNLHLDNVTFNNMKRGIQIPSGGMITMENQTLGHFQNISDLNWWPASALFM